MERRLMKTQTERTNFFVNCHVIERIVKKNGQPLNGHRSGQGNGARDQAGGEGSEPSPGAP